MSIPPSLNNTEAYLKYLNEMMILNKNGADTVWISSSTYLVFFMMAGFAFLESGSTRHNNLKMSLLKNVIDRCITTVAWWLIGYGFSFGASKGGVIGLSYFAGVGVETFDQYTSWMFQWAFVDAATGIVSGCVVERITLWGYACYSAVVSFWIYPLIAHWIWNQGGWLYKMGIHDFAGSGVVHMVGGVTGLAATILLGPRIGIFPDKNKKDDKENNNNDVNSHSAPLMCLGTLILWFCWYGFNCGSTQQIVGADYTRLVGKIGMNTSISAAFGGLTSFFIAYFINRGTESQFSLGSACNGVLGGLVGITAACDSVESMGAMFIGIISGIIYFGYTMLFKKLRIDDPIDAVAVHFGCGSWGVIAYGWFDPATGVLYGKGGHQFGIQLLGVVVIFLWVFTCSAILFCILKLCNIHKVSPELEFIGQDMVCGGLTHQFDQASMTYYMKNFVQFFKNDVGFSQEIFYRVIESKNETEKKQNVELQIKHE